MMKPFGSLRVRFVVGMLAGVSVFSAAVLVVADRESRVALHGRTLQAATSQLVAHSQIVAARILIEDEVGVRSLLVGVLKTNPDWTGIELERPGKSALRVVRRAGDVVVSTDGATPSGFVAHANVLDGTPGTLVAWVSEGPDRAAAAVETDRLLLLLLLLSAGGLGTAAIFGRWLTDSLVMITERVRALGEGKLGGEFPVPNGEGEVTALDEALQHATRQLAEAERHLVANRRRMVEVEKLAAVGSLAAGVAHDIVNPIAGAAACVRRLGRDDLEAERRHQYASLATEALERASRVLGELLAYARPSMGGPEEVDVRSVVESATRLVASSALREFRVAAGPELSARWPRQQVVHILSNLLQNAGQAASTQVVVTWTTREELVVIEITDDGPGIAEGVRPRVFEPFFTTRPVGQGAGLGLSVSLALANKMGGWIELQSGPGVPGAIGTIARFTLPKTVQEITDVAENTAG